MAVSSDNPVADTANVLDLNYDGNRNGTDKALVLAHVDHWHRNLLHGTLVRRTS